MCLTALVIGFGSIGKRHADILNRMDEFDRVAVLSNQTGLPYETITSLEDISSTNPDYVVIASPTAQHHRQLQFLEANFEGKKVLVEKPLFVSSNDLQIKHNQIYVGYNLRFHHLLRKIKDAVAGKKLWNIQAFCGSYLPDWRPGRDYRDTSSAKTDAGGGVLLELSHELDYVQWLAGPLEVEYAVSGKVSDLEIDSDDLLLLSGKTEGGARVYISLNYFTRKPVRQIVIDGEGISLQGDLIKNQLSQVVDGEASDYSWSELERNDTYREQHRAILEGDLSRVCSFEEGLNIMRLIENIRRWRN